MKSSSFDRYLSFLGRPFNDLVLADLATSGRLVEVYSGSLTMYYEPEPGVDLEFWAETKIFEKLHFTLAATVPSSVLYEGTLEAPFGKCKNREMVLQSFGTPMNSKGPFRMPSPMGEVGGWDTYDLTPYGHPKCQVTFKYDKLLSLTGVTFSLKVTSFDKVFIDKNN